MTIAIENLQFQYANSEFRLQIPQLEVKAGETVAVIGPSGCGKTTLLHLIAGIKLPNAGRIVVDGMPVSELNDRDRRQLRITKIGFVFQDFELLDYLNVLDNMLHPFRLNGALALTPAIRDRAKALARQVGIGDKLRRYANELSRGEQQRVAVCRALLTQPTVLLADEATGNLDPANKVLTLELLFQYVRERQASLLAVTHDRELLDRFDRTIDLKEIYRASPAEVK